MRLQTRAKKQQKKVRQSNMRTQKYIKAMPMIVELLKKKDVPMSVAEIHDALIWYWDMGIIRRAVRELLADNTIKEGFIKLDNEQRSILRMSLKKGVMLWQL